MKENFRHLLALFLPLGTMIFFSFKSTFEFLAVIIILLVIILSKRRELVLIGFTFIIGYLYESFGMALHYFFNFGWYYPPFNYPPLWLLTGWIYFAWSSNILSEKYENFFIKNRVWAYAILGILFIISTIVYPEGNFFINMIPIIGIVVLYWRRIYTPRLEFTGILVSFFDVIAEHVALSNNIWVYDYAISIPTNAFLYLICFPLIIVISDFISQKINSNLNIPV